MANLVTTYFFPPQWDFELGGEIALGNIIADPLKPQDALNEDNKETLPTVKEKKGKPDFTATITVDSTQSIGLETSLLELFGLGAGVKAQRGKTQTYEITAQKVVKQEINPPATWVEKCFKHDDVAAHLERTKYKKSLYMVVGVMAASSATVSSDAGHQRLFEAKVGVNLAPATGAPVALEASGKHSAEQRAKVAFGASDFILGYKLKKIHYVKTKRLKNMEDVTQGTVLDATGKSHAPETVEEAQFVSLGEAEVGGKQVQLPSVVAKPDDDDEVLEFVLHGAS